MRNCYDSCDVGKCSLQLFEELDCDGYLHYLVWWPGPGLRPENKEQPRNSFQHVLKGDEMRFVDISGEVHNSAVC